MFSIYSIAYIKLYDICTEDDMMLIRSHFNMLHFSIIYLLNDTQLESVMDKLSTECNNNWKGIPAGCYYMIN